MLWINLYHCNLMSVYGC